MPLARLPTHRDRESTRHHKARAKDAVLAIVTAGLLLGVGVVAFPAASLAGTSVYRFIDADGVLHFSDAPVDDRYNRVDNTRQEGLAITPPARVRVPAERDYDRLIAKVGHRYRVHPALVKAVIAAESNFEPDAVSHAGAQGMMQLMPATAAELGVERPFGVMDNIDGGVRYLRAMLDRYGDVTRALAAYNAGPTAVDRHRGVPPYRETQAYVKRVLQYYRGYWPEFDRPEQPVRARRTVPRDARVASTGAGGALRPRMDRRDRVSRSRGRDLDE